MTQIPTYAAQQDQMQRQVERPPNWLSFTPAELEGLPPVAYRCNRCKIEDVFDFPKGQPDAIYDRPKCKSCQLTLSGPYFSLPLPYEMYVEVFRIFHQRGDSRPRRHLLRRLRDFVQYDRGGYDEETGKCRACHGLCVRDPNSMEAWKCLECGTYYQHEGQLEELYPQRLAPEKTWKERYERPSDPQAGRPTDL